MTHDVVVVGAGVAGLGCARALGALGLTVLVLDRQATPPAVAKGELLQPESVRILDDWGALPRLTTGGVAAVDRLTIRDPAGRARLTLDYADLPGPYRQILCTDYPAVLRSLATGLPPGVEVRRGTLIREPLRDRHGRVAGVRVIEGERHYGVPARLVVAADGYSSRLRAAAGIRVRRRAYPHRLLALELTGTRADPEVCAYQTNRGLRLVYPLPGDRVRVYVQVRPDEFRGGGLRDLTGWGDLLLAEVPALAPLAGPLRHGLASRQLLAVYRLRTPRLAAPGLALAGEAAHAVHPMAAQGVSSSLADAEELARRVAEAGMAVPAALDRALLAYHESRLRRLDQTAAVSHNVARVLTMTTGPARLLGRRMMSFTATNPRLLQITAGNLAGVRLRPLTTVDRLYQLGLLPDPRARAVAGESTADGGRPR